MSDVDIYKMKLHEIIVIEDEMLRITRVAGGWLYETIPFNEWGHCITFVPFNNEFMKD